MFDEIQKCDACGTEQYSNIQQVTLAVLGAMAGMAAGKLVKFGFDAAVNARQNNSNITEITQ